MALQLGAIFKDKSIRSKVLFTLLAFIVYKIAIFITVPIVNKDILSAYFNQGSGGLDLLNTFAGGALQQFSIIALSVSPYITASIVMQLFQMDIIPAVKRWSEEGEEGKKKINQWTRYIAIILCLVQALGITLGFEASGAGGSFLNVGLDPLMDNPMFIYFYLAIIMTAGTCFLLWLGDQITIRGLGNGISMIIVAGILSTFPAMFSTLKTTYLDVGTITSIITFVIIVVVFLAIIAGIVFIQDVKREIPIQYANAQTNQKSSSIPIKLNSAGVLPVIFAVTLLSLPLQLIQTLVTDQTSTLYIVLNMIFNYQEPVGFTIYVGLIFIFAFFYSFMQINPDKIADDLKKSNAFIKGVRQGEETSVAISKILFRTTLLGATYLALIAAIPIIATNIFNLPPTVQLGGTSLLIVVGVAIETTKQLKTATNEREYTGFID